MANNENTSGQSASDIKKLEDAIKKGLRGATARAEAFKDDKKGVSKSKSDSK